MSAVGSDPVQGSTAFKDFVTRIRSGIFRFTSDPVWNVQVVLFFVGGVIEWLLIMQVLQYAVAVTGLQPLANLSSVCVAVAVMHQFLILRNIEVCRSISQTSWPKRTLQMGSTMVSVFLLATITGEVPYLLALLLFKEGPANWFVRIADVLDVLDYQSWTNVTKQTLQHAFPLYCKGLFFTGSLCLAASILFWDAVEVAFGRLREPYRNSPTLKVWHVFLVSDVLSILIWGALLLMLFAISKIPPGAIESGSQVYAAEQQRASEIALGISAVTIVYAVIIGFRIFGSLFRSKRPAHELQHQII